MIRGCEGIRLTVRQSDHTATVQQMDCFLRRVERLAGQILPAPHPRLGEGLAVLRIDPEHAVRFEREQPIGAQQADGAICEALADWAVNMRMRDVEHLPKIDIFELAALAAHFKDGDDGAGSYAG